ncbi:MAG: hypothetical protein ABII18_00515 [bacterium]|nr:hypothetical protein [bacterium]MBU1917083.1 hypothetical protein [bacterium]
MIEKTIYKYLPKLQVSTKPIRLERLPLFLNALYSFEKLIIDDTAFLAIIVNDKKLGPREFKKHGKLLKEELDLPQVWFMRELHYHKIQTLIENGINFVVEDKQVYLPMLHVVIKPEITQMRSHVMELNGLAIQILERELIKKDLTGKNKLEIAEIFNTTQMTAGRAIERLLTHELCFEEKKGVSKNIIFKQRDELWDYFKNNVLSPVKFVVYADVKIKGLPFSNITALSKQTMLADDDMPVYAIDKKEFKLKYTERDFVHEDQAIAKIEVWNYRPILVEKNTINPLDAYLLLKDHADERVQIELQELLKQYNLDWEDND